MFIINKTVFILVVVSVTFINAKVPAFEGLKVNTHTFPTAVMTNTELAYIEGVSSTEVKKFVFSLTKATEDENSIDYAVNNKINDEKSFFMFSNEEIENANSSGKECSITENKEYKLSELQTMCESLYTEINTKITKFSKTINVEYYNYYFISVISAGKINSISLEAANTLINIVKVNPTTYSVKSHFFKICDMKGIYIKNDKIIYFLYESDSTHLSLSGNVETNKVVSWVDKTDYSEIRIKRLSDESEIITKIYSLSANSNIVHYKGIYEISESVFILPIGESISEDDISTEITTQLTNIQKEIKDSYKQKMRMRNLNENKQLKEIKANTVDSWFYEDVTSDYYKGYFICGEDFIYIEKTKSNDAKVLEKIILQKKIDLTTQSPTITISDTNTEMKITLKETVKSCDGKTEYKVETVKQLCPTADPKLKEVIIEFSKAGDNVNMIILSNTKYMKQSTIQRNTELLSLIGLETNAIPIGKYISHEETYVNDFHIIEDHYYRVLKSVEMDLSESDREIKDYIKVGMSIRERIVMSEKTQLGELYFFIIPNLNDKYLIQRTVSDFYKYDSEFNSYDSDLNGIMSDTNNKVDLMIKRLTDFMKDNDDDITTTTTTSAATTLNESTETAPDSTSQTTIPDTTKDGSTTTLTNYSTISTDSSIDTNTDSDDDINTPTTKLDDNSGCFLSSTILFVIIMIILIN